MFPTLRDLSKAFIDVGIEAFGPDIVRRTYNSPAWFRGIVDFLYGAGLYAAPAPNIVSNPPFFRAKGTETFIRRALGLANLRNQY